MSYPIAGAAIAGCIVALGLIVVWKGLMKFFEVYVDILFKTGFGVFWKRSGWLKRIGFIIGFFLWLFILLMLVVSNLIWIAFLIWAGIKILQAVF